MRITSIQSYKSRTFNSCQVFKGVSLGDFDKKDNDFLLTSGRTDNDVANKFEKGLKSIKENYGKRKEQVSGLFKKKKKRKIQAEEDAKISGFLKAQEISVQTQEKVVNLLEEQLKTLEEKNDKSEELEETKKALAMARKIKEKTELIANNKNKHKGFDSIGGYEREKFILTENFINLLPVEMAGQNVEIPNSIMFFGPIGNGKTSFAKAFAHTAGCSFEEAKPQKTARTKDDREKSFYKNLVSKAEIAQQNFLDTGVRTIILVDEIDRFAHEGSTILPKLKRFLESCSEDYHCTVFATTNNPLVIPPAIRGPKRMPIKVSIDPPDETNAALVFEHYLKDCPNANMDKIDLDALASEVCAVQPDRAYNNSQIESICADCIENCDNITQGDLIYYIKREVPGIDSESMQKYKEEKELLVGEDE